MGLSKGDGMGLREQGWRVPHRAVLEVKSLTSQVNELGRVINRMRSVYPEMVAQKTITRSQAEHRVAALESARRVLQELRDRKKGATKKNVGQEQGVGRDHHRKQGGEKTLFD